MSGYSTLQKDYFSALWSPRVLVSDNGFIEKKLGALLKKYGVHHKHGLGYHPQTNGQVEISNREIKVILEKTIARSRKDYATSSMMLYGHTVRLSRLPLAPRRIGWFMEKSVIFPLSWSIRLFGQVFKFWFKGRGWEEVMSIERAWGDTLPCLR